ncbi:MAG: DUF3817 domain-containing protein [Myxococcota bacterium]
MTTWLAWRLCKFAGVVLLSAGTIGAVTIDDPKRRQAVAFVLGTVGWLATWAGGYLMMKMTARSFEPWIVATVVASLGGLVATLRVAAQARPGVVVSGLATGGLGAALVPMVVRPTDWGLAAACALLGGLVGAGLGASLRRDAGAALGQDDLWPWFTWVARLEGASLLFLLLVHVPLRRLYDIELDGGTGAFGWIHGTFVLVYTQAVLSQGASWGWSVGARALGVVAALLPTGTFWFERSMR